MKPSYYLSIVLYFLFLWEKKTQRLFSYPVIMILRKDKIRKLYHKRGVSDPESELGKALEDRQGSVSSIIAGGHLVVLVFLILWSSVNIIYGLLGQVLHNRILILLLAIASYLISECLVFNNNRYLIHFQAIDRLGKDEFIRIRNNSIAFIFAAWAYACLGVIIMVRLV